MEAPSCAGRSSRIGKLLCQGDVYFRLSVNLTSKKAKISGGSVSSGFSEEADQNISEAGIPVHCKA